MPVQHGRIASAKEIRQALTYAHSLGKYNKMLDIEIVTPSAYPKRGENKGREHRCFIRDKKTDKILLTAHSAYKLLEKIHQGWKYEPNKKEGLFKCQE